MQRLLRRREEEQQLQLVDANLGSLTESGGDEQAIAARFRAAAQVYGAPGGCPLYARLVRAAAEDPAIPRLMSAATPTQRQPMLLLAAVLYELLRDPDHALAGHYPSVTGGPAVAGDPYPVFARFCRERSARLRSLLATRRVQTNEPGRCAVLLPAFAAVADRASPLALIELGAGAGLNLNWDRYGYRYSTEDGAVVRAGDHHSAVRIPCRLRGGVPPLPSRVPEVAWRVGVDLDPADPANAEDVRWLHACIWPDRQDRADRLRRAVELARARPIPMIRGDAVDLVRTAIGRAPAGATVCVFHSLLVPYLTDAQTADLHQIRAENHRVAWIACEPPEPPGHRADGHLVVTLERVGEVRVLARAGYHGEWLNWLDAGLASANGMSGESDRCRSGG